MPSPALQGGKEDGGARVQPAGGPVGQAVVTPCRLTRIYLFVARCVIPRILCVRTRTSREASDDGLPVECRPGVQ